VPVAAKPWVVSDELWQRVEPLLPKIKRRFRNPGRKRLDDRAALQGILFVLHTGIAWRHLPLELPPAGRSHTRTNLVGEGTINGPTLQSLTENGTRRSERAVPHPSPHTTA
jgi:transposase